MLPRRPVGHDEVRPRIAVEIADTDDLPVGVARRAGREQDGARHGGPVHVPDAMLPRRPVAHDEVRLRIAVEIADTGDLPVGVARRAGREQGGARHGGPVHVPDADVPGRPVAHHDVRLIIAVEIADAGDLPVGVARRARVEQEGARHGGPVHVPDAVRACRQMLHEQVGQSVAVEIVRVIQYVG